MRQHIMSFAMRWMGCIAMFGAVLIANRSCHAIVHQEEEPETVQKLRKF